MRQNEIFLLHLFIPLCILIITNTKTILATTRELPADGGLRQLPFYVDALPLRPPPGRTGKSRQRRTAGAAGFTDKVVAEKESFSATLYFLYSFLQEGSL